MTHQRQTELKSVHPEGLKRKKETLLLEQQRVAVARESGDTRRL
jgi:hypothetical protein